jgi:DNA-binding winged helix-turn-helix (wHTH) protein
MYPKGERMNATPLIVVDADRRIVEAVQGNGKFARVDLTPKERGLLILLARAQGRIVTREYAMESLWGVAAGLGIDSRTVDQHMARLRINLGKAAAQAIVTVTGAGYKIEEGTVLLRTTTDLLGRILKVVPVFDKTRPCLDVTIRMPHREQAPRVNQTLRLAEVQ